MAGGEFGGEEDGECQPGGEEGKGDREGEGEEAGPSDAVEGSESHFCGVFGGGPR